MSLAQSPPPFCVCGHDFHTGPCDSGPRDEFDVWICHCPDGELDADR